MELYSENKEFKLYHGSMLDMLEVIEPKTIDSIVTDPPYELNFMNKGWDNSGIAFQKTTWEKCYQVLKPGGYLLAFGGSRTFHRIACAIEDAGFEIRDTIMWLYGSGFPKSMNIGLAIDKKNGVDNRTGNLRTDGVGSNSGTGVYNLNDAASTPVSTVYEERVALNEWSGWGTALKPAYEPVIVARKPCEGSCVDNVMNYGVGGINIDECRIGEDIITTNGGDKFPNLYGSFNTSKETQHIGRFPSNVILTYDETDKEEVIGGLPYTESNGGVSTMPDFQDAGKKNVANGGMNKVGYNAGETAERKQSAYVSPMDSGSAARYFYCAKASKADREEGLDNLPDRQIAFSNQAQAELKRGNEFNEGGLNKSLTRKNNHPTVKPTTLMQYLIRLVTPKNGTVLDPFNGSGSTGKACMYENKERNAEYRYIGIELTDEYLPIAEARIKFASGDNAPISIPEKPMKGQVTFFDLLEQAE